MIIKLSSNFMKSLKVLQTSKGDSFSLAQFVLIFPFI